MQHTHNQLRNNTIATCPTPANRVRLALPKPMRASGESGRQSLAVIPQFPCASGDSGPVTGVHQQSVERCFDLVPLIVG